MTPIVKAFAEAMVNLQKTQRYDANEQALIVNTRGQ
jgi:hypothetical protein